MPELELPGVVPEVLSGVELGGGMPAPLSGVGAGVPGVVESLGMLLDGLAGGVDDSVVDPDDEPGVEPLELCFWLQADRPTARTTDRAARLNEEAIFTCVSP